jgi:RNA-directed DNA polymerase
VGTSFNLKKLSEVDKSELVTSFLKIKTSRELADLIQIKFSIFTYHLYIASDEDKYLEFEIKKRNGGIRKITAPNRGVKLIQSRLNKILQLIFPEKSCVHGFTLNKSIITNAKVHVKQKYLVNIDLENFFPTINFGRVRGLFLSHPFYFNEEIATILAQLSCFKGTLPQGAPTSPVISNFICRRLDNKLLSIALQNKCIYSRYADDITISTNLKQLPENIATILDNKLTLNPNIINEINGNGFKVNPTKLRFANKYNRQEVTGLITNKIVNVPRKYLRNVRAMLHAWEKYGIIGASQEHFKKYNHKDKFYSIPEIAFQKKLAGKINFIGSVKGKENSTVRKLYRRLRNLTPEVKLSIAQKAIELKNKPLIFAEGLTGWKHLSAAISKLQENGQFRDLDIEIIRYDEETIMSDSDLINICQSHSKASIHNNKIICLFDRDVPTMLKRVTTKDKDYRSWGNNVYSVALPQPSHRNFERVCIEHLYLDSELKTLDKRKRRLFLSNEFDKESGKHFQETLHCIDKNILKKPYPAIVDNRVLNQEDHNVALQKNDFAEYILNREPNYANFTFEHFRDVFTLLRMIVEQ